jgi:spermidine synthase
MNSDISQFRRNRAIRLLIPLFVFSGATSLVYETIWERQLHLIFGTSQVAVSTVLAAFMTGLAMGAFGGAKWADRVKKPILAYAGLELFIGLYAVCFPHLLDLVRPVYLNFYHAVQPSQLGFAAFQFLILGIMLLPPTFCMGMTLPLLARFATTHTEEAGEKVGRLYGANTIGAVLGTGLAGFVLLPKLGLSTTTWVTAGGNLLLCIGATALARTVGELDAGPSQEEESTGSWQISSLALVAMLAGMASLMHEVAWFRVFSLILGASAYAFTIMLLSFLLGIGIGGWKGGRWADKLYAEGGFKRVVMAIAFVEAGVALLTWIAMWLFGELPWLFVLIYDVFENSALLLWAGKLFLAMVVMVPPALLMGAAFPLLVRAAAGESLALGKPVGRLYGWNTFGAILGASLGGLVIMPWLQVRGTIMLAICINLLAAAIAYFRAVDKPVSKTAWMRGILGTAGAAVVLMLLASPWNPLLMTAGTYKYVYQLDDRTRSGVYRQNVDPYELLYYAEGLTSVVTVAEHIEDGDRVLANNGKIDASNKADMPTQVLVSHMPFFYRPNAEKIMMVGLAAGYSAGAVTLHTSPTEIDLVEIEGTIIAASRFFDEWNHKPLDDPRVNMIVNDARNELNLQAPGTYDLIISEPSNPWLTGVSNLFTREYFQLGKSRLKPDGIWSQWIQLYGMDTEDLRSLLGTFSDTYNYVHMYSTIYDADLVLVGSDSPLDMNANRFQTEISSSPALQQELEEIDIFSSLDLLARFRLSRSELQEIAKGVERNTDDNMRIEYSAPLHLYTWTGDQNVGMLNRAVGEKPLVPYDAVDNDPKALIQLAKSYANLELWIQALMCLKQAEGREPGRADVAVLYDEYQLLLKEELAGQDEDDVEEG